MSRYRPVNTVLQFWGESDVNRCKRPQFNNNRRTDWWTKLGVWRFQERLSYEWNVFVGLRLSALVCGERGTACVRVMYLDVEDYEPCSWLKEWSPWFIYESSAYIVHIWSDGINKVLFRKVRKFLQNSFSLLKSPSRHANMMTCNPLGDLNSWQWQCWRFWLVMDLHIGKFLSSEIFSQDFCGNQGSGKI